MMKKSGIYKIVNLINNKIYIGSAKNIEKRWREHKNSLRINEHINGHLQNAWNKYGEENFQFEVVEYCEKCELIEREQFYLDLFCSCEDDMGYNICKYVGSTLGRKMSDEQRNNMMGFNNPNSSLSYEKVRKMIDIFLDGEMTQREISGLYGVSFSMFNMILKGKVYRDFYQTLTEEEREMINFLSRKIKNKTRIKMSNSAKGKIVSIETRRKMGENSKIRHLNNPNFLKDISKFKKGSHLPEETKQKMREKALGRKHSEETRRKISESKMGQNSGEENINSKLTWEQVREIREKYKSGNYSQRKLAKEYDVSRGCIQGIINNITWIYK